MNTDRPHPKRDPLSYTAGEPDVNNTIIIITAEPDLRARPVNTSEAKETSLYHPREIVLLREYPGLG